MGILNNTVSICQFKVVGTPPQDDITSWVGDGLKQQRFRSIEQTSEELSIGWVQLDDAQLSEFSSAADYQHDHYIAFSLRRDQRKLPGTLLKAYIEQAEDEFLAANPTFNRVPKQKREELRDAVRGALFARTLPTPAVYNAVWDTQNGRVSFSSLSSKVIDLFVDLFNKSFEPLRLVPVHPYARAEQVSDDALLPLLQQANRASSDAVLELMDENRWLGRDFLLWLMYETMNGSAEYGVCQPGPAGQGEAFAAYLNDRLILASES
ncbi:MAG: recombination-associated protein RdgC, partial [Desulfuromonadales bacterium]|nr:recombination-associated protein RdgC [Desulfuromonadales bacterium]